MAKPKLENQRLVGRLAKVIKVKKFSGGDVKYNGMCCEIVDISFNENNPTPITIAFKYYQEKDEACFMRSELRIEGEK